MVEVKKCTKCKLEKSLNDDFSKNPNTKDGKASWCRTCFGEWHSEYEKKRRRDPKTRSIILARDKKWNGTKTPRMNANYKLKQKYGISLEEKEAILRSQNNVCRGCGSPDPKSKKGWNLDHDHKTGEIRGVLCRPCNLILGFAKDSSKHLEGLIDYLESFNEEKTLGASA